jgi:hypothetical protein
MMASRLTIPIGLESDIIHVKSIEVSPDPPQPGKDLTVTVVGTADQEIGVSALAARKTPLC